MSYAWRQLQSAVRILATEGDRRGRLQAALAKLIKLKPRDLPSEVAEEFLALVDGIARFPARNILHEIRAAVAARSDAEVLESIATIMRMVDAVSAYQPRPLRSACATRRRDLVLASCNILPLHALEARHGTFFHETA